MKLKVLGYNILSLYTECLVGLVAGVYALSVLSEVVK